VTRIAFEAMPAATKCATGYFGFAAIISIAPDRTPNIDASVIDFRGAVMPAILVPSICLSTTIRRFARSMHKSGLAQRQRKLHIGPCRSPDCNGPAKPGSRLETSNGDSRCLQSSIHGAVSAPKKSVHSPRSAGYKHWRRPEIRGPIDLELGTSAGADTCFLPLSAIGY